MAMILFFMRNPREFQEEDLEEMQRGLDLWEELLRATGGVVEPLTSGWYFIFVIITIKRFSTSCMQFADNK